MLSRRDVLSVALAGGALAFARGRSFAAEPKVTQDDLLRFAPKGQVTLLHMSDVHGQLLPLYFREPAVNLGAGDARDRPPHLTGEALLNAYGIQPGSLEAYALDDLDFVALARTFGRVGGMDRLATLIAAIRAERGAARTLLLDGGDALHGSYTVLKSQGGDMASVLNALGVDATTGHWEFTLGQPRVTELYGEEGKGGIVKAAFLAGNVRDTEFGERVFPAIKYFEKGGVKVAVIGQAFPFTPIANPRWMMPGWSFGIREAALRRNIEAARRAGAELIVLLSHNGLDVDLKLAGRVEGIDVILSGHTHDALPKPLRVGRTLVVASGSHGKFLSRLDIEVKAGRMVDFSYALIPVLADAIAPDPVVSGLVRNIRSPHEGFLSTELARTENFLFRRGNFNGSLDDVILDAMLTQREAEIAFSPGFRWGTCLLPGQAITWDDLYNATAITYPACTLQRLKGSAIREILEDVADNLFNRDPYYAQGGDMVRVGGLDYSIDIDKPAGRRISDLTLRRSGEAMNPEKVYAVAGWASVQQGASGPPIWDVVADHLRATKVITARPQGLVRVRRG